MAAIAGKPDLNDLSLMNEVVEVNGAANPEEFFTPPLADDGEHLVVLSLGNRGIVAARQWEGVGKDRRRTGTAFLNVHVQGKALKDDGSTGPVIAFDNLTSIVMNESSSLHAAFALAGYPLPTRASLGEVKQALEQAIAQHPQVKMVTRWEAQVNTGTKDAPNYVDVLKGQANFPKIYDAAGEWTGRYEPEVTDAKSGQKCRAQVRVIGYKRA